jgi:hypothetical protein
MEIPSDLLYFVSQIQNYSKNTVKLQTLNQTTLGSGQATQARVSLPVNAICNMKSLSMHANFNTFGVPPTGAAGVDGNAVYALIPRNGISSVLDRVSWTAGGIALDNAPSLYHTIYNAKMNVEKGLSKYMTDDKVLANAVIEAWNGDVVNYGQSKQLIQNNFLGFTELHPSYLDLSLLSELFLTLQVSDNSVLPVQYQGTSLGAFTPSVANANFTGSQCRFTLTDIFFTVEVVSVSNGLYSALTERLLSEKGSIDVPYRQYNLFSSDADDATTSLRGSVSTMSLDKLYGFFRNSTAQSAGGPYNQYYLQQAPVPCDKNTTFAFNNAAHNLISSGINDWTFRVNNSPYPLYRADTIDAYNYVVCGNGRTYDKDAGSLIGSQETWLNNCWLGMVQLNHNDDLTSITGMDLRSINSQITFESSGTGGFKRQAMLLTQQTSLLRIGQQRSLAVIS